MENRVVTFSNAFQFRSSESGDLCSITSKYVFVGNFLGAHQTHKKSPHISYSTNLRDLALLFVVWRWLEIILKKRGAMSETFSQAAKRLIARLNAREELVRLPMTPAGRALLRHDLAQGRHIALESRNFDYEAMNSFNLKTSEH